MNSHPDANLEAVPEGDVAVGIASGPQIRPIGSREFASTLITNVVIQACTIVQGILVARLLGPVGRGQIAAAILCTGLFLTLVTGTVVAALCAAAIPWLLPGSDTVVRNAAYLFVPFILFNQIAL